MMEPNKIIFRPAFVMTVPGAWVDTTQSEELNVLNVQDLLESIISEASELPRQNYQVAKLLKEIVKEEEIFGAYYIKFGPLQTLMKDVKDRLTQIQDKNLKLGSELEKKKKELQSSVEGKRKTISGVNDQFKGVEENLKKTLKDRNELKVKLKKLKKLISKAISLCSSRCEDITKILSSNKKEENISQSPTVEEIENLIKEAELLSKEWVENEPASCRMRECDDDYTSNDLIKSPVLNKNWVTEFIEGASKLKREINDIGDILNLMKNNATKIFQKNLQKQLEKSILEADTILPEIADIGNLLKQTENMKDKFQYDLKTFTDHVDEMLELMSESRVLRRQKDNVQEEATKENGLKILLGCCGITVATTVVAGVHFLLQGDMEKKTFNHFAGVLWYCGFHWRCCWRPVWNSTSLFETHGLWGFGPC